VRTPSSWGVRRIHETPLGVPRSKLTGPIGVSLGPVHPSHGMGARTNGTDRRVPGPRAPVPRDGRANERDRYACPWAPCTRPMGWALERTGLKYVSPGTGPSANGTAARVPRLRAPTSGTRARVPGPRAPVPWDGRANERDTRPCPWASCTRPMGWARERAGPIRVSLGLVRLSHGMGARMSGSRARLSGRGVRMKGKGAPVPCRRARMRRSCSSLPLRDVRLPLRDARQLLMRPPLRRNAPAQASQGPTRHLPSPATVTKDCLTDSSRRAQ
jgi:hypothetical protein